MKTIIEDVKSMADWISNALLATGYNADYSIESLKEVDRFFDDQIENGHPRPNGLLSEQLGVRIFALGAYIGEVIRRATEGTWHGDDADPRAEINVELRLPNKIVIWPIQRAMKRLKNGREDAIFPYASIIVTEARRPPAQ